MAETEKWFSFMRGDIDRAKKFLDAGNIAAFHYFLGRVVGDVRILRELVSPESCESNESSDGS